MFQHVLVALAGSPTAAGALALADRLVPDRLTVLTLLGSQAQRALATAPVPVPVAPAAPAA